MVSLVNSPWHNNILLDIYPSSPPSTLSTAASSLFPTIGSLYQPFFPGTSHSPLASPRYSSLVLAAAHGMTRKHIITFLWYFLPNPLAIPLTTNGYQYHSAHSFCRTLKVTLELDLSCTASEATSDWNCFVLSISGSIDILGIVAWAPPSRRIFGF